MGTGESKPDWQEDYVSTAPSTANPKPLKHKRTHQKCELLALPVIHQDQPRYIERITTRTNNKSSRFVTPLVNWQLKNDGALCGTRQQLMLVFGEVSPTLQDFLRYRRAAQLGFSEDQILYVLHNVALALKDIQNMKEEHGKVDLTSICITNDVYLKDNLLLEEQEKLIIKRKSTKEVQGFPSPQKLRAYYDSLTSFEELRGDLFSLGIVALQLYHTRDNIKALYNNPDPRYRNHRFDLEMLSEKTRTIPYPKLRSAIEILTNMESKKRLEIYELLKDLRIDLSRLPMLRQSINIEEDEMMKNAIGATERTSFKTAISSDNREINKQPERVKPSYGIYSPQLQKHSQTLSAYPPLKVERYSQNYRRSEPETTHIPYVSNYYTSSTLASQTNPTVHFNPSYNPELHTSTVYTTTKPLFPSEETKFSSVFAASLAPALSKDLSYMPSLSKETSYTPSSQNRIDQTYYPSKDKINELTYVSAPVGELHKTYESYRSPGNAQQFRHAPTFQQILDKVKQNNPDSVLNKLHHHSILTAHRTGDSQPNGELQTFNNQKKAASKEETTYSAFERRRIINQEEQYIPRSANVAGTESIYHEEPKEETKNVNQGVPSAEKQSIVQSIDKAESSQIAKESPQNSVQGQTEKQPEPPVQTSRTDKTEDERQGIINAATSTVSAIPEENQSQIRQSRESREMRQSGGSNSMRQSAGSRNLQSEEGQFAQEIPFFNGEFTDSIRGKNLQQKQSYRSIGSIGSDPRIVVVEPIDLEPSSPLRQGAIFVTEEYEVGTKYEGYMLDGMRHGKGKFYYKEGSYYDGEWRNNKMHGFGTLYYPNGTIAYEGEWKNDEFDGKGKVFNDQQRKFQGPFDYTDFNQLDDEWIKYEGDLKSDAKDGFGRLFLTNGDIYQGEFYKDMVHGVGKYKSDKSEKKGIWEHGRLKKLL